jgi:hypothetical protein
MEQLLLKSPVSTDRLSLMRTPDLLPIPLLISLLIPALLALPAAYAEDADSTCAGPGAEIVTDLGALQEETDDNPSPVYYGTRDPQHVTLTSQQVLAIGTFGGCTGTVVADQWVITAKHCNLRSGARFCVGEDPEDPDTCVRVSQVYNARTDMTLVKLERPISEVAPQLQPIPLFTGELDRDVVGQTAEASGYGQQESGGYGEREFTAQPISSLGSVTVAVDGEGRRGLCFGDSGGPLMVQGPDGKARIIGVLSEGDSSCVGVDNFTRVDVNRQWLEGYLGPLEDQQEIPEVERIVVECPEGTEKYQASTYAFRETFCAGGGKYIASYEGTWWVWQKKLSGSQMQFVHPETGEVRTFTASQLAWTAAPGTLEDTEEVDAVVDGDAVDGDAVDPDPVEEIEEDTGPIIPVNATGGVDGVVEPEVVEPDPIEEPAVVETDEEPTTGDEPEVTPEVTTEVNPEVTAGTTGETRARPTGTRGRPGGRAGLVRPDGRYIGNGYLSSDKAASQPATNQDTSHLAP